jgi:hypothetical protein
LGARLAAVLFALASRRRSSARICMRRWVCTKEEREFARVSESQSAYACRLCHTATAPPGREREPWRVSQLTEKFVCVASSLTAARPPASCQ